MEGRQSVRVRGYEFVMALVLEALRECVRGLVRMLGPGIGGGGMLFLGLRGRGCDRDCDSALNRDLERESGRMHRERVASPSVSEWPEWDWARVCRGRFVVLSPLLASSILRLGPTERLSVQSMLADCT